MVPQSHQWTDSASGGTNTRPDSLPPPRRAELHPRNVLIDIESTPSEGIPSPPLYHNSPIASPRPSICSDEIQPSRQQYFHLQTGVSSSATLVGGSAAASTAPSLYGDDAIRPVSQHKFKKSHRREKSKLGISASETTLGGAGLGSERHSSPPPPLPTTTLASPSPKQKRRRNWFRRICHRVNNHVSPKAIWELIDIREFFWPITLKKYIILSLVAAAVASIVVSNHYTQWIQKSMAQTRAFMLPVLIIVIGLEPLMFLVILIASKIPRLEPRLDYDAAEKGSIWDQDLSGNGGVAPTSAEPRVFDTAFVIPCHNSDTEALKRVLDSAYPHFRPRDIFIVDNGRSRHPKSSEFRNWVRAEHHELNYIWSPIGSKNAAQLVGSVAARDYKYILTADDDVSIPSNYRSPTHLITDEVKAVAFPLKAIDARGRTPLFMVAWQDCEYRMAGLTKLAESALCGVCFPHGAGWFCERAALIELISEHHPIDFIAEDVQSGFSLMKMKKRIAFDSTIILETEVPTTILGPGLNWWKQRMKSWEMGRHGLIFGFASRLFFSLNGQRTIKGVVTQKLIMVYSIASIIVDWVRIPVFVTMGSNASFWRTAMLLSLASIVPLMLYKYIKCRHRPDLAVGFWASVTFPAYKMLYSLVSVFGAVRCVLYYFGGHKKPKTIRQMVRDRDENVFWLDPRFEFNPAWLADEGEALERGRFREKEGGACPSVSILEVGRF